MRRRRLGLILIGSAVVPLAIASTAWACGVLATLKANPGGVAPGQTVNVTGTNYSSAASASEVSVRLNGRTGPVLATTKPPAGSTNINTPVQIPGNTAPGWKVLVASQTVRTASGDDVRKSGTPGRTAVRVGSAAQAKSASRRRSEGPGAAWSDSKPTGPSGAGASATLDAEGSGSSTFPTLLGIVMSLGLLGVGVTLVGRSRTSTANRPLLGA